MQHCSHDPPGGVLRFLVLTGCRVSERCRLLASDVDEDTLTLRQTKSGTDHVLPVTPTLKRLLISIADATYKLIGAPPSCRFSSEQFYSGVANTTPARPW